MLDLQPLAVAAGLGSKQRVPSLKAACEAFLNASLCKEEQRSDWGMRPLRESQLEYAALDALACVRLWQVLRTE